MAFERYDGVVVAMENGEARIIYYWDKVSDTIYMLFIYAKADTKDLTPKQINILARAVQEDLR